MILVDANLLIYAINRNSPLHEQTANWLNQQFSANSFVGLPWLATIAFLRIITNPRIFPSPLNVEDAIKIVDSWLARENVHAVHPGLNHWSTLSRLLMHSGTGGNLTNDAHLAAIAIDNAALMCSADNDFKRFIGVQHHNPLEESGIREPMLSY